MSVSLQTEAIAYKALPLTWTISGTLIPEGETMPGLDTEVTDGYKVIARLTWNNLGAGDYGV